MSRMIPSLFALSFLVAVSAQAAETGGIARVIDASATSTYDGKKIAENQVLTTVGALKTGRDGGAKLKLVANEVTVEIAANSEIKLSLPPSGDPSESIELIRGKVRVRVPKNKSNEKVDAKTEKPRFLLRHRKMTMGVRGTDFLAVTNDDLDETELVVFEGEVEFTNEKAPKETQFVTPGFWSGIGGRFGEKVRSPMKLSASALKYFEKFSRDSAPYVLQAAPVEKIPAASETSAPGH